MNGDLGCEWTDSLDTPFDPLKRPAFKITSLEQRIRREGKPENAGFSAVEWMEMLATVGSKITGQ
jgi:hypothetical protein